MGSRRVNKNNTRPLINVKENKDKKTAKVNIAGFEDHEIDIYYASGKLRVISNHTRDIDTDIITPIDHSVDIGNNYILNEIFTQNKILFIRFSKLEKGSTDKYPIGYNRFAEQSKYVK